MPDSQSTDNHQKQRGSREPAALSNASGALSPVSSVAAFAAHAGLAGFLFLVALPLLALGWIALVSTSDVWLHLLNYVLPRSIGDTLVLLALVGLGTTVLGAGCAWITTMCAFPGRRIMAWALVLPLAVPTYIAAYSHVEFFDYSGPVQSTLRAVAGFENSRDYWFPDIRSLGGAAFIFSVVLYPYVYLTSRLLFSMQGASVLDASRSLGARPWEVFIRVALPMARPALAAGVALALMETLNDIGAVEILGVKTLTYAVFETWLNRNSLAGAVQLALVTLVLIAGLVWVERRGRQRRSYAASTRDRPPARMTLTKGRQTVCLLACCLPLLAGLGVPLWILGTYALRRVGQEIDPDMIAALGNSLQVALSSAALATAIAYAVLQYARAIGSSRIATVGRISTLGYAVPGTVLAVGLLVPLAGFDNWLDAILRMHFGVSTGLLFSGSVMIVIYACTLRFMAISYGTIETGFSRLSLNIDMAARALGRTKAQMAWQIHRPILTRALAAAYLLVFVDAMKELSATLLLRPFDFETLATFIYDRASQSALEEASIAALLIVLIGTIPVLFLSRLSYVKQG